MTLLPPASPPEVHTLPVPAGINHGASLLRLPGGGLLACWYSGASEAGPDAVILCARGRDEGAAWSEPAQVSRPHEQALGAPRPAKSVGNVVLAADGAGRIVMIVGEVQSRRWLGVEACRNWRCGRIDFRLSADNGLTWSAPTRLDDRPGALPRGRPLPAAEGRADLPVYQEAGRPSVLSLDLKSLRTGGVPTLRVEPIPAATALIQPSLVPAGDGQPMRAYLRDPHRRFVYVSAYNPARRVWSQATPTDLQNPASAVEAFRDKRGRTVLIHNPGRADRSALRLDVSLDGIHFPAGCDLVPPGAVGERGAVGGARALGEVAYPSVAELGPSQWGLTVSTNGKHRIGFLRFDQAWIDACAGSAPSRTP